MSTTNIRYLLSFQICYIQILLLCTQATGWPAIFFAAKNGKVNILTKLLERGARTELEVGQH